jgi:uncharacterized membrane protein YccC
MTISKRLVRVRSRWSGNGPMTTAFKASLAAVCAWLTARYLLGHGNPYFAPISALVSVQATVVRSVREGVRYVACFALGVLVALASAELLGQGLLSLVVTVLTGTLLGGWVRFGAQGLEVPFTAIFVLLLGGVHPEGFVLSRLVDVVVGVPFGIAVNLFLLAPLHVEPAAEILRRVADDIAGLLEDMATGLSEAWPVRNPAWVERAQALDPALRDALRAMSHAHESVRLNPRAPFVRPQELQTLWHCFADVRGSLQSIAHSLGDCAALAEDRPEEAAWLDERFRHDYANLLRTVSPVVRHRLSPDSGPRVDESRRALGELREELHERRPHAPWYTQSHLLIELNQVLWKVYLAVDANEEAIRPTGAVRPAGE